MSAEALLRMLLPAGCTGDEALEVAKLLQRAIDALWDAHGEEMVAAMSDYDLDHLDTVGIHPEDEIPF